MPTLAVFSPAVKYREITLEDIPQQISSERLTWVSCIGLRNQDIIKLLRGVKEIPDFLIEDCTTSQRPKIDEYESVISIVFKAARLMDRVRTVQINIIFGKNYILTIAPEYHPVFDQVKLLIDKNSQKISRLGVGYLLYALLESVIDTYFPIIDEVDETMERAEERIMFSGNGGYLKDILMLRKNTLRLRRFITPEKEIVRSLARDPYKIIAQKTMIYFRDSFSDILSISERLENQRELLTNMMEIHTSTMSNNLNMVMKKLTVITALVLVPGLIAGIYGMNVAFLPYAKGEDSFYIVMAIMVITVMVMTLIFKLEKWI